LGQAQSWVGGSAEAAQHRLRLSKSADHDPDHQEDEPGNDQLPTITHGLNDLLAQFVAIIGALRTVP
jgi:hypothetical protein